MRRALRVPATVAVASLAALGAAPRAGAAIVYGPCPKTNQYACGQLQVGLDPSGATPGTVTLSIRRHRAAVGEARSAIIALAGGPGQAAIPFAEQFAELLGPIADTRDLIVYDQRGTGSSQPLSCKIGRPMPRTLQEALARCAAALGPARAYYTSADTVADIEAIRQAGGYEKLVLFGTSYGTKVAEEYAQAYPAHVEALVLDSVVAPEGPDVLGRPTFQALPRVMRQICTAGVCHGVTPDPLADLSRVLRRIRRAPLRASAIVGEGRRHSVRITAQELLATLLVGDFSGRLRAEFVTDVRAAALGDYSPLARTLETLARAGGEGAGIDEPLYYATSCEEQDFPWSRSSAPARRLAEARAAARALAPSTFAPFSAADALAISDIPACSAWPYPPTPRPSDTGPLPAVRTLILSGADDLRTPTATARALARAIPGAHLLVVPFTGHSVLGEDPSACSGDALQALFDSRPIKACHVGRPPPWLRPQPPPSRSLAAVTPIGGYTARTGRTARGIELTIADIARQLALERELAGAGSALFTLGEQRIGGLRSGWAALSGSTLALHGYSLIGGLTLSGTVRPEAVELHVGGARAAHGLLRRGSRRTLVGTLGGQRVRLPANSEIAAAIVGIDAATSAENDARRRLGRARPGLALPGARPGGAHLPPLP